jgi:hypothetical protein
MWIPLVSKEFKKKIQACFVRKNLPIHVAERKGKTLNEMVCSKMGTPPRCTNDACKFCIQNGIEDLEVRKLCRKEDMVYELSCGLCAAAGNESWYCGQTVRPVGDRYIEHWKAARKCAMCPINDESKATKEAKKNAVGIHYFECHRNEEPQLKCNMVYKTHGSLERDCMEGTAVRRIHRYNMNRRLEDNGIKFD